MQESAESVVPDTDDDIGHIATVQSYVMLKSKDITSRGVLISGEAVASLLLHNRKPGEHVLRQAQQNFLGGYEVPKGIGVGRCGADKALNTQHGGEGDKPAQGVSDVRDIRGAELLYGRRA